ncbi:hypothetical protein MKW92_031410 [Papaver armeniacum]|nr:hypothetical protein MKW92_031410 [Papaver armeniacum]
MADLRETIDHISRSFDNLRRLIRGGMEDVSRTTRAFEELVSRTTRAFEESDSTFNSLDYIRSHMKKIIVLDEGEVCSVCLQDMIVGDHAILLKCSHIFHQNCMLEWAKRKPSCPLCRHDVRKDRQQQVKRKRLTYQ